MQWNVLVVDDENDVAETTAAVISGQKIGFEDGSTVKCEIVNSFDKAIEMIAFVNFDLVILDLKDDHDNDDGKTEYGGQRVLNELRKLHFTPVVFYTGFAQKLQHLVSPFIRVVVKGESPNILRNEIKSVFDTQLPQLLKHIQEEQRKYLWDHVDKEWEAMDLKGDFKNELAFLLARRLANALDGKVIRKFFDQNYDGEGGLANPVELYIWPPLGDGLGFGDIVCQTEKNGEKKYFVVLNPACDFVQCKAQKALLAACDEISATVEYQEVAMQKKSGAAISKTKTENLKKLIRDNRQGSGVQAERYKFLPATSFIPALIIDYQNLLQLSVAEVDGAQGFTRVATLDAPYAEAVQSRFIRYYGRVGTPDLEFDAVVTRVIDEMG
jgi:CheY-like chemotaxis protein